ncbi:MAG TPA: DUF4388 domain-containing protein [Blastocatellia bacterium]|nr:DUF4388 domain-containing protein [Blastocatellia bacterium]
MDDRIEERRLQERVNYRCDCEVAWANPIDSVNPARIRDIGAGGAFIDLVTLFPVGSILRLKFSVLGSEVSVGCEVRHSPLSIGLGVRFLDLSKEDQALIERAMFGPPILTRTQETVEPVAPHNTVIAGHLSFVSIFDVFHIIGSRSLTGMLSLRGGAREGEIYFKNGLIGGASIGGETTGKAALESLLAVTDGTFEFEKSEASFQVTVETPDNTSLLLELLVSEDSEESKGPPGEGTV